MSKRRVPEKAATPEEFAAALEQLEPAQLVRLKKSAQFRHRSLGERGVGRVANDLLSDAVEATLDERRYWVPANCDVVRYLLQAMRSIASHMRDAKLTDAMSHVAWPAATADAIAQQEHLDSRPGPASDPESELAAEQLHQQLYTAFDDDPEAQLIYEARIAGQTPDEIRAGLQLSEKEYETIVKRVRRTARRQIQGGSR